MACSTLSPRYGVEDHVEPLSETWRARIATANEQLARDGMRVLGVAFRPLTWEDGEKVDEVDLIFVGMAGMIDPPRGEVREAVATCKTAGIRPVMITGDHPLTALAIARDLLITSNERVLTGADITACPSMNWSQWLRMSRFLPEYLQKIS